MSKINENLKDAGQKIADAAKNVGQTVAEKANQAADWVKEKASSGSKTECGQTKSVTEIRERMDVIASCGKKVGVIDHLEGGAIKLTKSDSPDGQHHFIPMGWVDHVDTHVHLKKNSSETEREWKNDPVACLICGA
jgi:hypothetical protein